MVEAPAAGAAERRKARAVMPRRASPRAGEALSPPSRAVWLKAVLGRVFQGLPQATKGRQMLNTNMGKRLLLFGLLVMSGMSTQETLAQAVVFLKCTYFNGLVERIKIDPNAEKTDFLNGGTFAPEVSERLYALTVSVEYATI